MASVYDPQAFRERVNLAASYIAAGREQTRTFEACFEMHDGDVVGAALYRRAAKNPSGKLAANLPRYMAMDVLRANAAQFSGVATRDLPKEAEKARRKAREDFIRFMWEQGHMTDEKALDALATLRREAA